MNTELKMIRQTLESRLKQAAGSYGLSDSIHIQQLADPADVTQEAAERDVAVQIIDRESALARHIRAAIDRIDDGSYGICLECEEEIAPKRLKAIPWAELCIDCQERADGSGDRNAPIPAFADFSAAA
jgi:RNA polymerase-binding transcription factor